MLEGFSMFPYDYVLDNTNMSGNKKCLKIEIPI